MIEVPADYTASAESPDSALFLSGETACSLAAPRRVVLDTNVLVSLYVFADSRFAPIRARVERGEWMAFTNDACLGEFRHVLEYPIFSLTGEQQSDALAAYDRHVTHFSGPLSTDLVGLPRCRDRDDQKFLELARDAAADWLVTADKALLRLARHNRLQSLYRILTPETALSAI